MSGNPVRRIRVRFRPDHNPKCWAAYYEPPGRAACYCHAPTLPQMWEALRDYFSGNGVIPPQRVGDRFMRFLPPTPTTGDHHDR